MPADAFVGTRRARRRRRAAGELGSFALATSGVYTSAAAPYRPGGRADYAPAVGVRSRATECDARVAAHVLGLHVTAQMQTSR